MANVLDLFDLTGKTALITGGSRGLGAEIAEGLAEAGAKIFILARREKWLTPQLEEFRERGFQCDGTLCDVTDPEQVEAAIEKAEAALGPVDILINNAGVTWGAKAEEMPLDKWKLVVDVNLTGTWLFSQAVGKRWIERSVPGTIVNVSSIAGIRGGVGDNLSLAGYAASKAGVLGLTRELAGRWGSRGIRINSIAPGFFPSRMSAGLIEQVKDKYEAATPLRRIGRTGELKASVLFFASDASSYITGQTLAIDGGQTAT